MQIQLRDLAYFSAIVEHGQVQRAAEALGLSQPGLSKGLRRLEAAMKSTLFKRTPKGVELTTTGSALLSRIGKLRLSLEDVTREIAEISDGRAGMIRLGANASFATDLLPAACALLLKEAPELTLKITLAEADAGVPALFRGTSDLYVTANLLAGQDDLVQEHLFAEERFVFASARHRLAAKRRLTLADLVQERWLVGPYSPQVDNLQRAFASQGLPAPRIAVEVNSAAFRRELVATTNLLALGQRRLFRERTSKPRVVELPVQGLSSKRSIGVCYRRDAYLSPAAQRFIEILKATAGKIATD